MAADAGFEDLFLTCVNDLKLLGIALRFGLNWVQNPQPAVLSSALTHVYREDKSSSKHQAAPVLARSGQPRLSNYCTLKQVLAHVTAENAMLVKTTVPKFSKRYFSRP